MQPESDGDNNWEKRTMIRERHESTWPFLCALACLFVLAAVWPRAWESSVPQHQMVDVDPCWSPPGQSIPAEVFEFPEATPQPSSIPEMAGEFDFHPNSNEGLPPRLREAVENVNDLELAQPADKLANGPTELKWPEFDTDIPMLPETASSEEALYISDSTPSHREEAGYQPPMEVSLPLVVAAPSAAVDDSHEHAAWPGVWPRPVSLMNRLADLASTREASSWVEDVQQQLQTFASAGRDTPQLEILSALDRLQALSSDAAGLAERLGDRPPAVELRRTRHALVRRLDFWQAVIAAGGPAQTVGESFQVDPRRLSSCLAQINGELRNRAVGGSWREYLKLDELERLSRAGVIGQEHRVLAGRIIKRLTAPDMTTQQRQFIERGPAAGLELELSRWMAEPVSLGDVLLHVEQYEQTGLPSDSRLLARDHALLELLTSPGCEGVCRQLQAHYRNANVRIAITNELPTRLLPEREPECRMVSDCILGKPVHGHSLVSTDLVVRMIPDPSRLRLALEVRGLVSALTTSTSGPATFLNDSQSSYLASKEIEINMRGLQVQPARITVDNNVRLRSVSTSLDVIPIVGSVAKEYAESQHQQSQPEMKREVERKIAVQVSRELDEETDQALAKLDQTLRQNVLEPLSKLSLGPTVIGSQTTDRRLTMRLRLADESQLGGHTPRPRAPADSLASCQLHESALNNAADAMQLDGGSFTLAEIRRRISEVFDRPEMLEEPGREDVSITFAEKDALRLQCQQGRIAIVLSIAKLSRAPNAWHDFQVRAYYRPVIDGRSAQLVRDGLVELTGRGMNFRSQIPLRGIFSKTFSKNRPCQIIPPTMAENPQMSDLEITQFAIDDGWIGVALGYSRSGARPVVAEREVEAVR